MLNKAPALVRYGWQHKLQSILKVMPPHQEYVELFGGLTNLMFAKQTSMLEVYNDLDHLLVNFFRVVRDPKSFSELYEYAILDKGDLSNVLTDVGGDISGNISVKNPIPDAYRWFAYVSVALGVKNGEGFGTVFDEQDVPQGVWLNFIKMLPQIHDRVMRTQVEYSPWKTMIERYNMDTTLMYIDAYRSSKNIDVEEMAKMMVDYNGMALWYCNMSVIDIMTDAGWESENIIGTSIADVGTAVLYRNPKCIKALEQAKHTLFDMGG